MPKVTIEYRPSSAGTNTASKGQKTGGNKGKALAKKSSQPR